MSTLGQMNPTESSRPISRCFCKLVSGEKKRCFAPLHPVTCKLKLCTISFGFFCLPETHTMLVSNQVLAQQNGPWSDPRISLPVVFTGQY